MSHEGYAEMEARRARKIAMALVEQPDRLVRRYRLAEYLTTRRITFTPAMITNLWPSVERMVQELGCGALYAMRPTTWTEYRLGATTTPYGAMLAAINYEKSSVTRARNMVERGVLLDQLIAVPDLSIALPSSRMKDRNISYLDQYRRHEADLVALRADLITIITAMPEMAFTE